MRIFLLTSSEQNAPLKRELYYWLSMRHQSYFDFLILSMLTQTSTVIQGKRKNLIQTYLRSWLEIERENVDSSVRLIRKIEIEKISPRALLEWGKEKKLDL